MVKAYDIPTLPLELDLEDKAVLKQCNLANRQLAELKGLVHTIPNESILLNTLTLQEAKDSSEVENIVTTQDDLYKYELRIADSLSESLHHADERRVLSSHSGDSRRRRTSRRLAVVDSVYVARY